MLLARPRMLSGKDSLQRMEVSLTQRRMVAFHQRQSDAAPQEDTAQLENFVGQWMIYQLLTSTGLTQSAAMDAFLTRETAAAMGMYITSISFITDNSSNYCPAPFQCIKLFSNGRIVCCTDTTVCSSLPLKSY